MRKIVILFTIALFTLFGCKAEIKLAPEKAITSFVITNLTPQVTGVIDEAKKTITVTVPYKTDVTALIPNITVSAKATVNPASGIEKNFSTPVSYVVTAENSTIATYIVTVVKEAPVTETIMGGEMSSNRILPDLGLDVDYIIDGMLYLGGNALLTIEPGVKILFTNKDSGIDVGENAGLKMVGTAEKPIIFSGPINNPNKGSWKYIRYHSKRGDNLIEHVQFLRGGAGVKGYGMLHIDGTVSLKNSILDSSSSEGLVLEFGASLISFSNNIIRNCTLNPLWITKLQQAESLDVNNTFTGNGKNYVYISEGEVISKDMTLKAVSIPYFFESSIYVPKALTIEPGVTLLFNNGEGFEIQDSGKLLAEGTSEKHIVFRGLSDEAGYWDGIIMGSTLSGNTLIYCDISGGGKSDTWSENHNIYLRSDSKTIIRNTTISKSYFYGIVFENQFNANCRLSHSQVTFSGCRMGNVYDEESGSVSSTLPM